ncbi:MAG: alpha/beta hydrolase [Rhodobacterales bacterium]|nr:alpha/beta hydrolase [Rhodobacterales bacterium]
MTLARWLVLVVALAGMALSVLRLEQGRGDVVATRLMVGTTPATVYRLPGDTSAPIVVIAHGFAGSRQLMESFALTLAQAGYIAVSFDFLGHGRNPVPMSGDVTVIEGTTQLMMDELGRVSDAALALPGADGRLALLGHSMASDIVVRQAIRDPRVDATVALSMFSLAVTPTEPRDLLIIAGEWEGFLSAEALKAAQMTDPAASFGETVGDPAAGTARRAVLAPRTEHVSVLYSATSMREARNWLDAAFGRTSDSPVARRGGWIALLLVSTVALGWPLAGLARRWRAAAPPVRPSRSAFLLATLGPAIVTPLVLWPIPTHFLPVLVADYLAVHFALYGTLALVLVARARALRIDLTSVLLALPVAAFGIALFGGLLDRYVASFFPTPERFLIIGAVAVGAVPFMLSDAFLTEGGRAPLWRTLMTRTAALASLGLAVVLDPEDLFFLVMILPIILLFFLLFGTAGGWLGRATWRPAAAGLGLGVFLAWALGVTFPLFAA